MGDFVIRKSTAEEKASTYFSIKTGRHAMLFLSDLKVHSYIRMLILPLSIFGVAN